MYLPLWPFVGPNERGSEVCMYIYIYTYKEREREREIHTPHTPLCAYRLLFYTISTARTRGWRSTSCRPGAL